MARKNKEIATVSEAPMKERLEKTIESLETQLRSSRSTQMEAQKNEREWKKRVAYANDLLSGANDPDALEAIGILKAQAEEYLAIYKTSSNEDNGYIASVENQLEKLRGTLASLDLIEKKRELAEHLRSISSGNSVAIAQASGVTAPGTMESREIDNLIHTAKALIELRSDKVA